MRDCNGTAERPHVDIRYAKNPEHGDFHCPLCLSMAEEAGIGALIGELRAAAAEAGQAMADLVERIDECAPWLAAVSDDEASL